VFSGESLPPSFARTRHQLALASHCFYCHAAHQLAVGRSSVWSSWFQFALHFPPPWPRPLLRRPLPPLPHPPLRRHRPQLLPATRVRRSAAFFTHPNSKGKSSRFNLKHFGAKKFEKKNGGNLREIAAKRPHLSSRTRFMEFVEGNRLVISFVPYNFKLCGWSINVGRLSMQMSMQMSSQRSLSRFQSSDESPVCDES
jgi:hypothetical protein